MTDEQKPEENTKNNLNIPKQYWILIVGIVAVVFVLGMLLDNNIKTRQFNSYVKKFDLNGYENQRFIDEAIVPAIKGQVVCFTNNFKTKPLLEKQFNSGEEFDDWLENNEDKINIEVNNSFVYFGKYYMVIHDFEANPPNLTAMNLTNENLTILLRYREKGEQR